MTDKQRKIFRLVYSIVLSVLTVASGVLLIVQSERIYHSAAGYSREIVGEYLGTISPVLYIWIALVVGGAILWQVFPSEQKKLRATIYNTDTLQRLKKRLPAGVSSEKLEKAEIIKKVVWSVAIVFTVLAIVMVGVVVLDKDNYRLGASEFDPTRDMLNMLPRFLPWVAAAFVVAIIATVYVELSAKREVEEIKRLIVESRNHPTETVEKKSVVSLKEQLIARIPDKFKTENFRRYALLGTRISLAVLAITLFIVGIFNGGLNAVLEKATAICRECIGLG